MSTDELPCAIRATAEFKTSWLGRSRRTFRYDARFADGRILTDVTVGVVLQTWRFPADAYATRDAANDACPNVGHGPWVEYPSGRVLSDEMDD